MKLNEIKQLRENQDDFIRDDKEIRNWLKEHLNYFEDHRAIIVNGKVTYQGLVNLSKYQLDKLAVEFVRVEGDFILNDSPNLKTLMGSPTDVGGSFEISNCPMLRNFDGAPIHIRDSLRCRLLHLNSLEGVQDTIKSVGDTIDIRGTTVEHGGIGLLLIKGIIWARPDIWHHDDQLIYNEFKPLVIIEKYARDNSSVFDCQAELIENGFEENAKL